METEDQDPVVEDFAQALAALMDRYGVNGSDIARAIGVSPAAVNTWVHRRRVPRNDSIRKLADAYPAFSVERLTAAAGRKAPGPLLPEREERMMNLIRELTEEQQETGEILLRALRDSNRR